MASAILSKYGYSGGTTPYTLTISLGGLASSTAGVGRQGTIVDNSTTRYPSVLVYYKIKLGTSPTAYKGVYFLLIRDDGSASPQRTDGAGAADTAINTRNALLVGQAFVGASPSTGDVLQGDFVVPDPGPKWTLAVAQDSGAALDATAGNHVIEWIGLGPEVQ